MEKPEPKEIMKTDKLGYNKNKEDNYGGMEYRLIAWAHFNILNDKGQIKNGKFAIKLFKAPFKLPPFNENIVKVHKAQLEFSILEYEYDKNDLKKQLIKKSKRKN